MLSPNFAQSEFEIDAPIPPVCLPVLTDLCSQILEPVREQFGPQRITSGYRPPDANAAAHGQPNSEHIYSPAWAACDFVSVDDPRPPREVFDWMRNNPTLPFHQLIYETDSHGGAVIHVSINKLKPGVRSVLQGATHNSEPYVAVEHVPYNPSPVTNADTVQTAAAEG